MQRTKLLIVDDDPELAYLLEEILPGDKFELFTAQDGAEGIALATRHAPHMILLDLVMPGLTGNDLLVALKQRGVQCPIIVMTKRGDETKAIEAFRLGATDFVTKPIRPPELVQVIEHSMEEVRLRQEKAALLEKVQTANTDMQEKVRELTSLANIGRVLTGLRSIDELFEVVLESMIDMTAADHASVILRDVATGTLTLSAGKNLTLVMQEKLGEEIKDELAQLVLTSREPLVAAGEGLQRFKLPRDIRAVVYVPMIAHNKAIGVLTVGNHKKRSEFTNSHARLLTTMGDYVAIGITNARLFSALDMRARNSEEAIQLQRAALLKNLESQVYAPLLALEKQMSALGQTPLPDALVPQLESMYNTIQNVLRAVQHIGSEETQRVTKGIHRIST